MNILGHYLHGSDVIAGDFGTGNAPSVDMPFGPLSPEDLSKLTRPLSKDEQKAVDDWKKSQAKAAGSKIVKEIRAYDEKSPVMSALLTPSPVAGIEWWKLGLGALGGITLGVFFAMRRR